MLSWLACGRVTSYFEADMNVWDLAAGCLLVKEAGGRVTDVWGGDYELKTRNLVASNGKIHDELLGRLIIAEMWIKEEDDAPRKIWTSNLHYKTLQIFSLLRFMSTVGEWFYWNYYNIELYVMDFQIESQIFLFRWPPLGYAAKCYHLPTRFRTRMQVYPIWVFVCPVHWADQIRLDRFSTILFSIGIQLLDFSVLGVKYTMKFVLVAFFF